MNEFVWLHAERIAQIKKYVQRYIPFPGLESRDVCPLDKCLFGKLFLAHGKFGPSSCKNSGNRFVQVGILFHACTVTNLP